MRISDWSSDVCYSDLLLLPKLVIGDMLEHLFPEGKLVVSDFGGPVVRRPVATILIIVIAAGRGDRAAGLVAGLARSEERRVGKECVSTCSSRWSPDHAKNNRLKQYQSNTFNK